MDQHPVSQKSKIPSRTIWILALIPLLALALWLTQALTGSPAQAAGESSPAPLVLAATPVTTPDVQTPSDARDARPGESALEKTLSDTTATPVDNAAPAPASEPAADRPAYELPEEKVLPERTLSLKETISRALEQNLDVKIKLLDDSIAGDLNRQAVGAFNPVFNLTGTYEDLNRPQNSQDYVATGGTGLDPNFLNREPRIFKEDNFRFKAAIEGKLPVGTKYELFSRLDVLRNTLNTTNPLALFTPEYQSFTGLTLTQPLWKGFGTDVNLAEIRVARKNKQISELEFRSKTLEVVATAMQSYYDLAYLSQEMALRREEKELALRLTRDRKEALERGQSSSRDVNRAESALAETIEDLTKAKAAVYQRQAEVLSLISDAPSDSTPRLIVPITALPAAFPLSLDAGAFISEALAHRPEYLAARHKIERENIRLVYAENQIWPQVDFQSTAGVNGLTGDGHSTYRKAFGDTDGFQWSVGVVFSVPLGNDTAIGARDAARKRKEQALLELQQVETNTALSVQQLVSLYQAQRERLQAMRFFRDNAQKALSDLELRQERGQAGDVELLKFKRDLTDARTRELAALADLQKVLVRLYQISGTLLERENITLSDNL